MTVTMPSRWPLSICFSHISWWFHYDRTVPTFLLFITLSIIISLKRQPWADWTAKRPRLRAALVSEQLLSLSRLCRCIGLDCWPGLIIAERNAGQFMEHDLTTGHHCSSGSRDAVHQGHCGDTASKLPSLNSVCCLNTPWVSSDTGFSAVHSHSGLQGCQH